MKILVLNSGSSSQKACLYEIGAALPDHPPASLWEGRVEFGSGTAALAVKNLQGAAQKEEIQVTSREQVARRLLSTLIDGNVRVLSSLSEVDAVGHRVVHGGPHFAEPVEVTQEVRATLAEVTALAPLHIPPALEGMEINHRCLGADAQVTAFRPRLPRRIPPAATVQPRPS